MQTRNWFIVLLLAVVFASCTDPVFYEKSYSFPKNTWNLKVKPMFKVEITDTSKLYDFTITFRTTTDYPFNNCWIYLNTKTPNKIKAREPFEIKITNPDGTWIGKKSGTIVENQLSFKRRKFPLKGVYFFELEQAVVQENLDEALDVGIRIEEAK
ncbi:MAG: gliding motility lipoprotein GldH [Bacteroidota bacterium]